MKKTNPYQVTEWYRSVIRTQIKPGDLCIDATMGNGHDTLFLSQLAGPSGCVLAFDIQQAALDSTKALLQEHEHLAPVQLLLDSHAHMSSYADPGTVSCIVFNLGYLPSGDHSIATHKESTIVALEQGLELLKTGGCISLCISVKYSLRVARKYNLKTSVICFCENHHKTIRDIVSWFVITLRLIFRPINII